MYCCVDSVFVEVCNDADCGHMFATFGMFFFCCFLAGVIILFVFLLKDTDNSPSFYLYKVLFPRVLVFSKVNVEIKTISVMTKTTAVIIFRVLEHGW